MAGTTTAFTFARGALSTRESLHPVYVSGRTPFDFSFAAAEKASRAAQPARIKPWRLATVVFMSAWIISKDGRNRHDEKVGNRGTRSLASRQIALGAGQP